MNTKYILSFIFNFYTKKHPIATCNNKSSKSSKCIDISAKRLNLAIYIEFRIWQRQSYIVKINIQTNYNYTFKSSIKQITKQLNEQKPGKNVIIRSHKMSKWKHSPKHSTMNIVKAIYKDTTLTRIRKTNWEI